MSRFEISDAIASQLPGFVRSDYPTFIAFLKAYYDYLKDSGVTIKVEGVRDIDTSVAGFIEHIKTEIAPKLPLNAAENRFKMKHMADLYDSKGSSESFKILFRMLYDRETEVDYPSRQMLIPSDGRWVQPFSIFVRFSFINGDPLSLIGKIVKIQNGFQDIEVFIEQVLPVYVNVAGVKTLDPNVYQIFINKNFYGKFVNDAVFKYIGENTAFNGVLVSGCSKVQIKTPGSGFKIGEFYEINTSIATGAVIKINKVDASGGILEAVLISSGINYSNQFSTNLFAKKYSVSTGQGFSVSLAGTAYSVTMSDATNPAADAGYVIADDYVDISYTEPDYVGTILKSFSDAGVGSTLDPNLAAQIMIETSPLVKFPGYFNSNAGFLSDALYIQDSFYYQAFSYVVKIDRKLEDYGGVLKTLLHPAGTALFGEFNISDELSLSPDAISSVTITT